MKHIIIITLSAIIGVFQVFPQSNFDAVIAEIEKNNTTLIALRKQVDAQKIANRTGNTLANPEVEFAYLFGNPAELGNRTNLAVSQSFDFPTAYKYRKQIANIKNEQAELEYQSTLKSVLFEARSLLCDLVYFSAMETELNQRMEHATQISGAYKTMLAVGEANILEYNKAQLNSLNAKTELQQLAFGKDEILGELARLNGGASVNLTNAAYNVQELPTDFEQWYTQAETANPLLNWLKQEVALSQKLVSLNKAENLPKLKAGYLSEQLTGEGFRGVSFGVSIPLWENKNVVKHAKANIAAVESTVADNKVQFYNGLKTQFGKTLAMKGNYENFALSFVLFNNTDLLTKAFEKGEISLTEYILELSMYYDAFTKMHEMERDYNKAVVELNRYK